MPCCQIQWIDDKGDPTPDKNAPVGVVFMVSCDASGLHEHAPSWICAEHLARMPIGKGYSRTDGYWSEWHFVPLSTERPASKRIETLYTGEGLTPREKIVKQLDAYSASLEKVRHDLEVGNIGAAIESLARAHGAYGSAVGISDARGTDIDVLNAGKRLDAALAMIKARL